MADGLQAPIAVYAAQIEQESSWRPEVCSPYACGLAQFTAETADWAAMRWRDLRPADVFSPSWAIRAMIRYDGFLLERVGMREECDAWAAALAAYNGGLGWIRRDKRLCAAAEECDPEVWWANVEEHTDRAEWARRENRHYPWAVLRKRQPGYRGWGGRGICE